MEAEPGAAPDSRGITFAATCVSCKSATVFEVSASATRVYGDANYAEEFYLSRCKSCEEIALYSRDDYGDGYSGSFYRCFPPQTRTLEIAKLPALVRESYNEAVRCEEARAWLACAVMVGRTLEAISKAFDPSSHTLATALGKLFKDGAISQDIFDWANELRVVRNLAAHAQAADEVTAADATEGLDFAQAILEILYDLKPKFEKMKARRKKEK